ncbi:ankyrin repeat domain-containing protein [Novosphingobium umbonatum]|uniref:Ankyrin repeat domain-containing protein n=2 Tax=Novosphingobium umbonatum TaxID=1908524 RepID=A0A3S2UR27_9SPHN|nr:ankyrin repeat domain-containing protein [Novosphingobium umbonatum]
MVMPNPAAAQFSKSYEFLENVRKKEGQKVTDTLSEPGSQMVNTRDITTGDTALHIVTARRDAIWISFLLAKGADPNIRNVKGETPLVVAASYGFGEGIELLIAGGARVDEPNSTGETPLISAVHRRDIAMMRVLLKAGANPERADSSGRSARDYAKLDRSGNLLQEIDANAKKTGGAARSYGPSL